MDSFPTNGALRLSASAGSGKTYSLTNLYLKKALQFPDSYKGILAMTFTNKAATELKERIIQKLIELTTTKIGEEASIFGFDSAENLKIRAEQVLNRILHDFDSFKVTTIDSFFQSLFTQLAFESNLPHGLKTEIDLTLIKQGVLEESLKNISNPIKAILLENILQILSKKGTGWRTTSYLEKNLLDSLFSEKVVDFSYSAPIELFSDAKIVDSKQVLESYINGLVSESKKAASTLLEACANLGFLKSNLSAEEKTFIQELTKIENTARGDLPISNPYKAHFRGEWQYKPKSKKFTSDELSFLSDLILQYANTNSPSILANISLAEELLKHLSAIRLLVYFRQILKDQNQRQNRFLLFETKYLLKSIIGDSDVPYIFEKLGNQIHTLLIDEFQDTDLVQWKVIEPLAKAILDKNGFFSVVGDVKQSIYGWRGADSTLFKTGISKSLFPYSVVEKNLSYNYRSEDLIVRFNNLIFSNLSKIYPLELRSSQQVLGSEEWDRIFQLNYEDVYQKVPATKKTGNGFVDFRVRPRRKPEVVENEDENQDSEQGNETGIFDWIIQEIKDLQKAGIGSSEIAILVRGNSQLNEIVRLLDNQKAKADQEFDFRFSASGSEKNGDHLVFDFLATSITNLKVKDDLYFQKLVQISKYLGLDEKFWNFNPGEVLPWIIDWKKPDFFDQNKDPNLQKIVNSLIIYFGLNLKPELHQAIIQFQNLAYQFDQEGDPKYPDFLEWWNTKAAIQNLSQTSSADGIQIMTIHKSKGLDFGVVILALNSTTKSDGLHEFDFWPKSDLFPWNTYPLQKANAKKGFLESDLGLDYEENIYKQALENLNLWYVACTRPKYGLVVDITLDTDLEPPKASPGKLSRLAYQIPAFIKNNQELVVESFPGANFSIPASGELIFRCQIGKVQAKISDKEDGQIETYLLPNFGGERKVAWLDSLGSEAKAGFGNIFHKILEKTNHFSFWKNTLEKYISNEKLIEKDRSLLLTHLEIFFRHDQIKVWFSNDFTSHPELEFVTKDAIILRADRVLEKDGKFIILDFKTGEKSEDHFTQLRNYQNLFGEFYSSQVKGFLVYSSPEIEIIEIDEIKV